MSFNIKRKRNWKMGDRKEVFIPEEKDTDNKEEEPEYSFEVGV